MHAIFLTGYNKQWPWPENYQTENQLQNLNVKTSVHIRGHITLGIIYLNTTGIVWMLNKRDQYTTCLISVFSQISVKVFQKQPFKGDNFSCASFSLIRQKYLSIGARDSDQNCCEKINFKRRRFSTLFNSSCSSFQIIWKKSIYEHGLKAWHKT